MVVEDTTGEDEFWGRNPLALPGLSRGGMA
jgi:hypothetical protein